MHKIQKARKEYECSKCKKKIKIGEDYVKKAFYFGRFPNNNDVKIYCIKCDPNNRKEK